MATMITKAIASIAFRISIVVPSCPWAHCPFLRSAFLGRTQGADRRRTAVLDRAQARRVLRCDNVRGGPSARL